jgi:uncharacterized membrane protein
MTNVIVASFDKDTKAIEAMHKLSELDNYGDISIYGKTIVRAKEGGKYEILSEDTPNGWRTLTGMGAGTLFGMLGGPVGLVVGLFTGTTIGIVSDVARESFDEGFINKVEKRMAPGTVSIIAEIDEDSDVFVNNALLPLGAEIKRSNVDFEFDDYMMDKFDAIDKELTEAKEKLKNSIGREKEKIANKIEDLKEKRNQLVATFRNDIKNFNEQISSGIAQKKAEVIKNRISRYEAKLQKLHEELHEVNA